MARRERQGEPGQAGEPCRPAAPRRPRPGWEGVHEAAGGPAAVGLGESARACVAPPHPGPV